MASDVFRFSGSFWIEQLTEVRRHPLRWRSHARVFGAVFGLPIVPIALAGAYLHFLTEERFNENLLFDLVARPTRAAQVPELAA